MNRRPKLQIVAPGASSEEAAAVAAALERFMRDHAPVPVDPTAAAPPSETPWKRAALTDGVRRDLLPPEPWR